MDLAGLEVALGDSESELVSEYEGLAHYCRLMLHYNKFIKSKVIGLSCFDWFDITKQQELFSSIIILWLHRHTYN